MSTPLNPKQTQEIEDIRRFVTENPQLKDWEHYKYKALLLSIFDALQSKKQYTEDDLRAKFEQPRLKAMRKYTPEPSLPRHDDGTYLFHETQVAWYWYLQAAHDILGDIKDRKK